MSILLQALLGLMAFLLGSLPTGVWLARWQGAADPRLAGSRSSGATNLGRMLGWRAGVLTGLVDMAKGAAAVLLAGLVDSRTIWLAPMAGLLAVTGHIWTPLAHWRGGKGAATGAGAALVLAPAAFGASLVAALLVLLVGRRMAPASLAGAALLPFMLTVFQEMDAPRMAFSLILLFILAGTHRQNLARLAHGTEKPLW